MLFDLSFVETHAIRYNPALDLFKQTNQRGELAEWSKAPPWKGGIGATLSRVRIPLSPPVVTIAPSHKTSKCTFG